MKAKYILSFAVVAVMGLTSCLHTSVDDETFVNENTDADKLAAKFADKFTYDNGSDHANKVRVINNTGYACQLDYIVGKTFLNCGKENYVDVVVPFSGDLEFAAKVFAAGKFVDVTIPVHVDNLTYELPQQFTWIADGSADGKVWSWWADQNDDGSYSYIDGSWGPVGGGGYGWSATGPNWLCYGIGQADEWTGQTVTMDEWVKFDLDGGANITVHYSDGTEKKGTFSIEMGTTPAKAALGWVGTMKIDIPLPHQIVDGQASWYLDIPVEAYDIAIFDNDHLVLIAPGGGGDHLLCDPAWATPSTHWTFKPKK